MPETLVIVNTSPLLYLYQVNCLELLQQLYSTITAPPAVLQELEEVAGSSPSRQMPH